MPYYPEEKTRAANFRIAVLSVMAIVTTMMAALTFVQPGMLGRAALNLLVIDGLGCALLFTQRVSLSIRSVVFIGSLVLLVTIQSLDSGGIRSLAAVSYLVLPVMAAVLLGWREVLGTATACLIAAVGLVLAEKSGYIGVPRVVFGLPAYVATITMYGGIILMLLMLATRTLRSALRRAELALEEVGAAQVARKRAEHQLYQSQKIESLGTLAGGIAHDFTNLLMILRGNLDIARQAIPAEGEAREALDESLKVAQRARDLTQRLLLFARGEQGPRQPLSLRAVVEDTLQLLHAQLPASIRLETHYDNTAEQVHADGTQLQQVVLNLCLNALQAMDGQDGVLSVQVRQVERSGVIVLRLSVGDTGPGIAREVKDRIFEPFFSTKVGKGSGLGLSIVHGIVYGHGGDIVVDSMLGQGSTFHVHLPVANQAT